MSYRFRLGGGQLFLLLLFLFLVAALTFVTGLLSGVRFAERDALAAAELAAESGEGPDQSGSEESSQNGVPRLIYEIQLSSHLRQEETTPVVEALLAAGYQAFVVETRDSSNRSLYTVRIGPWDSMLEAAEASDNFREHSGLKGLDPKIRHRPKPATRPADAGPSESD